MSSEEKLPRCRVVRRKDADGASDVDDDVDERRRCRSDAELPAVSTAAAADAAAAAALSSSSAAPAATGRRVGSGCHHSTSASLTAPAPPMSASPVWPSSSQTAPRLRRRRPAPRFRLPRKLPPKLPPKLLLKLPLKLRSCRSVSAVSGMQGRGRRGWGGCRGRRRGGRQSARPGSPVAGRGFEESV